MSKKKYKDPATRAAEQARYEAERAERAKAKAAKDLLTAQQHRYSADAAMGALLLRTSEHRLARFASMTERRDPLWGDCKHPRPLKHPFVRYLDDARRDYLYRKAHGLPLVDPPDAPSLARAIAALDTLPDPRIGQVIRACCFAPDGTPLARTERRTEQAVAAEMGVSQWTVNTLKRRGLAHLDFWCAYGFDIPIPAVSAVPAAASTAARSA